MRSIPLGTKGTFTMVVAPQHLANQFKDSILPQVLATPVMILTMENAALNAIREFIEPHESAVGIGVNIRHLAATPVGHRVHAEAEVTKSRAGASPSKSARATRPRRSAAVHTSVWWSIFPASRIGWRPSARPSRGNTASNCRITFH